MPKRPGSYGDKQEKHEPAPQKVAWKVHDSYKDFESADSQRHSLKEELNTKLVKVHCMGKKGARFFAVKVGQQLKKESK